jgi:hypothetical protein
MTNMMRAREAGLLTDRTEYPRLRASLHERVRSAPPEVIEQLVAEVFGPGVEAEDVEDLFGSIGSALGNVAGQVAPVLAKAAPGAISGAAAGSAAGPYGALIGGLAGGLSSLSGGGRAPAAPQPAPPPSIPSPGPMPVPAAAPLAGFPAAGQLMSLISRPEVLQALLAMLMGQAGQRSVPVGPQGTPVGVGAITNLLGTLANQASLEHAALVPEGDESVPQYMIGLEHLDPAVPEHRAAAVLELFRATDREEAIARRRAARSQRLRIAGESDERANAELDEADLEYAMRLGALLGAQEVLEREWDADDDQ